MIQRFLVSLFLLLSASFSFAQTDTEIERELINYVDSSNLIVKNSRKLIIKYIEEKNYVKAQRIFEYIGEEFDLNIYSVFDPEEKVLFRFLIKDFESIIADFGKTHLISTESRFPYFRNYYYHDYWLNQEYEFDLYHSALINLITREELEISQNIAGANLSEEEIGFLGIYFQYILDDASDDVKLKSLLFLEKYPNSKYNDFLKIRIRRNLERGDTSGSFYVGGGFSDFSSGLDQYINIKTPTFIGFEAFVNRWLVGLRFQTGYAEVLQEFENDGKVFTAGLGVNPTFYGINGGFSILDKDFLRLVPMVEFGGISVSPPESERNDDNKGLKMGSFAYGGGLILDIFPFSWEGAFTEYTNRIGIRLQVGRTFHFLENVDSSFKGHQDYFGISLIYDGGSTKVDMR